MPKPKYITSVSKISRLSTEEREAAAKVSERYVFRTNEYYQSLIDWDDPNDPIVDASRAILDGHVVLTRELADAGVYPAIKMARSSPAWAWGSWSSPCCGPGAVPSSASRCWSTLPT